MTAMRYDPELIMLIGELKGRMANFETNFEVFQEASGGRMDRIEASVEELQALKHQLQLVNNALKILSLSMPGLAALIGKLLVDASGGHH